MRVRVRFKRRGPMRHTFRGYDDDCECDDRPLWLEIAKGIGVTVMGAVLAPAAGRAGDRLATWLFGEEEPDGFEMDADDLVAALKAAREEEDEDDDG